LLQYKKCSDGSIGTVCASNLHKVSFLSIRSSGSINAALSMFDLAVPMLLEFPIAYGRTPGVFRCALRMFKTARALKKV
jgi:hypothetical protein